MSASLTKKWAEIGGVLLKDTSAGQSAFFQHRPVAQPLTLMCPREVCAPAPVSSTHRHVNLYIIAEESEFVPLIQYC